MRWETDKYTVRQVYNMEPNKKNNELKNQKTRKNNGS